MGRLAIAMILALALRAQSPSQQIQAQQAREAQARGEEQRRAIMREQREAVEREHAQERLLQRRAEAERQQMTQLPETEGPPRAAQVVSGAAVPSKPAQPVQPPPDFSFSLMARAVCGGLLAGALFYGVCRTLERRLLHS